MKGQVPQAILDPILKEAAALAKLDREQLVIVRAESVVGTTARWDARNRE